MRVVLTYFNSRAVLNEKKGTEGHSTPQRPIFPRFNHIHGQAYGIDLIVMFGIWKLADFLDKFVYSRAAYQDDFSCFGAVRP